MYICTTLWASNSILETHTHTHTLRGVLIDGVTCTLGIIAAKSCHADIIFMYIHLLVVASSFYRQFAVYGKGLGHHKVGQ